MKLLAAQTIIGNFESVGEIGNFVRDPQGIGACSKFTSILSFVIGFLTVSAGLWFIVQIFTGGLNWLASGGDKQGVQNAQKRILHGIVGLLIVVLAYGITSLVGLAFGLNILSPCTTLLNSTGGPGGVPPPPPTCAPGVPC